MNVIRTNIYIYRMTCREISREMQEQNTEMHLSSDVAAKLDDDSAANCKRALLERRKRYSRRPFPQSVPKVLIRENTYCQRGPGLMSGNIDR